MFLYSKTEPVKVLSLCFLFGGNILQNFIIPEHLMQPFQVFLQQSTLPFH